MTNAISEDKLYVGLYLPGDSEATTAALLKQQRQGGLEGGELAYGLAYLKRPQAQSLNPLLLPLREAPFVLPPRPLREGKALPLTLRDALPDAWGRLVIAHELGGRLPGERELLLLTNEDRVGAMVFSASRDMPAPAALPPESLGQLAEAVRRLQFDLEIPPALKRLLLRGGSLGGARPKASFTHEGALWLAKFPAAGDPVDVQTLEATALALAARCGIRVPQCMTLPIGRGETTFLSRRFDRCGPDARQRLHYLSASALLDIPYESSAGSYVELARAVRRLSLSPAADLEELFRRLVFNLLIDNSDDHLKNHGMLAQGKGYRLSPAFDLVPQLTNLGYQMLSIDGNSQSSSLALAIDCAAHFDLGIDQAAGIVRTMVDTVYRQWRHLPELSHLPATLAERLAACFARQQQIIGAAAYL